MGEIATAVTRGDTKPAKLETAGKPVPSGHPVKVVIEELRPLPLANKEELLAALEGHFTELRKAPKSLFGLRFEHGVKIRRPNHPAVRQFADRFTQGSLTPFTEDVLAVIGQMMDKSRKEVLEKLAKEPGMTNRHIAQVIGSCEATVGSHLRRYDITPLTMKKPVVSPEPATKEECKAIIERQIREVILDPDRGFDLIFKGRGSKKIAHVTSRTIEDIATKIGIKVEEILEPRIHLAMQEILQELRALVKAKHGTGSIRQIAKEHGISASAVKRIFALPEQSGIKSRSDQTEKQKILQGHGDPIVDLLCAAIKKIEINPYIRFTWFGKFTKPYPNPQPEFYAAMAKQLAGVKKEELETYIRIKIPDIYRLVRKIEIEQQRTKSGPVTRDINGVTRTFRSEMRADECELRYSDWDSLAEGQVSNDESDNEDDGKD